MAVFTSMAIAIFYSTTFTTVLDIVHLNMLVGFIAGLLALCTSFCYSAVCPHAYLTSWKILTIKSMFPRRVYKKYTF